MTSLKFEPITLAPSFYQLGTPFFPAYLSVGEKAMLIEGGTSATFGIILSQLEALKIDPNQVGYIALTHSHADHVGAFPRFKADWPHIKIIASPAAAKMLGNENVIRQFRLLDNAISKLMKSNKNIEALPVPMEDWRFDIDILAKEGDVIDLGGGIQWQVYETPGHSPCQLAYFESRQGILAIGDATGFFNPEHDAMWPNYFAGLEQYCDSIKKLAQLPATMLVLSHNGARKDARDFLVRALKVTGEYHQEMLQRTGNGETRWEIAEEKGLWVNRIADQMPLGVAEQLSGLMADISRKTGPKTDGLFRLQLEPVGQEDTIGKRQEAV